MITFSIDSIVPTNNDRVSIIDVDSQGSIACIMISNKKDTIWEIYFDYEISILEAPNQPTLSATTTGGNIPRNTSICVRVTAIDPVPSTFNINGFKETPPSAAVKVVTTDSTTDTNKVTVSWPAVSGAASYNIYAGPRSGMEALVGNSVSTSFVIVDNPPGTIQRLVEIPSNPAIIAVVTAAGGGLILPLSNSISPLRIVAIATVLSGAPGRCAFSCIMGSG